MSSRFKPAPITGKGKTQVDKQKRELARLLKDFVMKSIDISTSQDQVTGALTYHLAVPDREEEAGYREYTITVDDDFDVQTDEQIEAARQREIEEYGVA